MKLSKTEQNYSRFRKIVLVTGLVIVALMAGNMLKKKDAADTLKKGTKKHQIFPQRQVAVRSQEPLKPLSLSTKTTHSATTASLFSSNPNKKHMCRGRRRRSRRRWGLFGMRRKRSRAWGLWRGRRSRWRTKPMKDHGKFELHGLTYFFGRFKRRCYYFDPSGRDHWSFTSVVRMYSIELNLGGNKYFCKAKSGPGQRCFLLGTDLRKKFVWKRNIVAPEPKIFTFGKFKFNLFFLNKARFLAYFVQNNQKIFLPKAQCKFLLSADKEKSFVSDGITYFYLDSRKDRCWSIINGQREEFFVSTIKDYGTFIGIDGIKYYYMTPDKKLAMFRNAKGERLYVWAKLVKNYGSFVSRGNTYYYKDATKKYCFRIVKGQRLVSLTTDVADYGQFTIGTVVYYFLDMMHTRAFTIDKVSGQYKFFKIVKGTAKEGEIVVGKVKKTPSIFFFFVGEDMYYYSKEDHTKCTKVGTTEVLNVFDVYKVADNAFIPPLIFFTMVDGKEVKYKFKDFSREKCYLYKEGEAPEKFLKFSEVEGDKWFKWGTQFWLFLDMNSLKGFNTKAAVEGLTEKKITLIKVIVIKTELELKAEKLEEERKENAKKEEEQFKKDQNSDA